MKQITIECFESGYSKLNTSDLHFKSESVATQIKVIFPENTLLYKWLDLKFGNNEERRYFLGDNQIETLDLTRDETIVGRLEITPFATNEIEAFAYKVAYDPKEVVIKNIVDATESVIEVPKEDIILATIEQYIDYIKQEMEILPFKRLEFDKDTNRLSAILNDESEISVILQRQDILDIISGNTIVGKAYADELGNIIKDHYAKKTDLFDKDYNKLINKPDLFSGSYNDLSNKPTLFDGKYSSLTGKPTKLSDFENDEEFVKESDLETTLLDYVEKEVGKGLSANDYTNADKNKVDNIDQVYTSAEKTKLSGIEAGAEVNEVNSVNGKVGTVVINAEDIGVYTKGEIDTMIGDIESALDAILGV